MKFSNDLTQEEVHEQLSYDQITGEFAWLRGWRKSKIAGNKSVWGYIEIRINGKLYKAHRIAWLYMTGSWPEQCIDHIDGDRSNNAFSNLRQASHADNTQNMALRKTSRSGHIGVCFDSEKGKWLSQLSVGGRRVLFKRYHTFEEACAAYREAKSVNHSFNPSIRMPKVG